MSERETWIDLIRNEYDPAPSHYKMGDNWDDGAGRIADAIIADKLLAERRQWRPIETSPTDDSPIWISDGEHVWLGVAHKDGSLKMPSRSLCKFWMTAEIPAPPSP